MNTDIRLSVEFFDHPKTVKLQRRLGLEAVISLQRLWLWAAQNRASGKLSNMDGEDIEIAAKWAGECGVFTSELVSLGWLDEEGGAYSLHDWTEHNPWQAEANARSEKARNAAQTRWNTEKQCSSNAQAMHEHNTSNAPLLSSPNQEEKKEDINTPPIPPAETKTVCVCSEPPSIEFEELRELYDREGRSEGPLTGFVEYKALKKAKAWPGIARITQALMDFAANDDQWQRGIRPGLPKFLREQYWLKQPQAAPARASPKTQKEQQAADAWAATQYLQGVKNGNIGNNNGNFDGTQPALPA